MPIPKWKWLVILPIVAASGCTGYQLGNRLLYRGDIRSVHVPIFESDSYRRFLGQQLTEAVVKQIELDTPLTLANRAAADSFLQGQIISVRKQPRTLNRFSEPRVLQIEWLVEVDWVDRSGCPLMERQRIRITDSVEFIPEGGQSLSSGQRQLIERVAQQIVGQMEAPW